MRPPERGPISSGLAFVDPTSGAVSAGPDDPAQGPEPQPPKLPPSWKRSPGTIYWSWSWSGAAWSDAPRAFWIGPGLGGLLQLRNGDAPPAAEPLRAARTGVRLRESRRAANGRRRFRWTDATSFFRRATPASRRSRCSTSSVQAAPPRSRSLTSSRAFARRSPSLDLPCITWRKETGSAGRPAHHLPALVGLRRLGRRQDPLEPRAPAARPAPSDGGCWPGLRRRRGGDKGRQGSGAGSGVPRAGTGRARPL